MDDKQAGSAFGAGGATRAAAGLLHPFTPRARKIWLGDEGMRCAKEIFGAIGHRSSRSGDGEDGNGGEEFRTPQGGAFARRTGIVRMAGVSIGAGAGDNGDRNDAEQGAVDARRDRRKQASKRARDFAEAARRYPDELEWDERHGRLFIRDGWVVDAPAYVARVRDYANGIFADEEEEEERRQEAGGAGGVRISWRVQTVTRDTLHDDADDNDDDDEATTVATVITAGAGASILLPSLPLTLCRSQNLLYDATRLDRAGAAAFAPLKREPNNGNNGNGNAAAALLAAGGKYLVPMPDDKRIVGGTTREYHVHDIDAASRADMASARKHLDAPLAALMRAQRAPDDDDDNGGGAGGAASLPEPVDVVAGVRAMPPRTPAGSIPLYGALASSFATPMMRGAAGTNEARATRRTHRYRNHHHHYYYLTGLGSRGLIHHAVLAKRLVAQIYNDGVADATDSDGLQAEKETPR